MSSSEAPIQAVLFDLDGTLYRQRPLRLRMMAALAMAPLQLGSLREARTTWRAIRSFRSVRESLRELGDSCATLAQDSTRAPRRSRPFRPT